MNATKVFAYYIGQKCISGNVVMNLLIQEESRQIDSYCEATTATGNPRISLMNKFIYFLYFQY